MKSKVFPKENNLFYLGLIFIVWLITYVICQFTFPHYLGWDEMSYLSVARGIAEDFDFSGRSYTVMGILKYGYPSNLINFPVFPIYLALFFKIFGASQKIAYFSTWIAALGVCYFIYFIFKSLVNSGPKVSSVVALSYLFFPTVLRNCDTAMMEQAGCFLLCLFVYVLLRDFEKGFNYLSVVKIGLLLLLLWLYKSLFTGLIFGVLIFLLLSYSPKITGKKINSKISALLLIVISYLLFAVLYWILKEYVFYPVAPMMNFHPLQESKQVYADFLGGLFNDFPSNIVSNIHAFIKVILGSYFIYPSTLKLYEGEYATYQNSILTMPSFYFLIGIYIFFFFVMIMMTFASWKKLSPIVRVFICFSLGSILFFNLALIIVFKVYHENFWRYNSNYLPLYICSFAVLLYSNLEYFKPFTMEHPRISKILLAFTFGFVYIPLFVSTINHYADYEKSFYNRAHGNAELVKYFVKDSKPAFIYFNDGIHSTFTDYPIKQVFKDATNEQLIQANSILPQPIEFLFLNQRDWLFQINKEKIIKAAPIINDEYKMYGYTADGSIVVYKRS